VAKGGYSLDLRIENARTTKDIDFSFTGNLNGYWNGEPNSLLDLLNDKAKIDLNDFMVYTVRISTLNLENAPYGGHRFPVEASMAGRRFAAFSIDIAAGDAWFEPHEEITLPNWLGFAGIAPGDIPVIRMEQHFAEKLHAYTQDRDYPNSRVKDLVDLYLILENFQLSKRDLVQIAQATFAKRKDSVYPPIIADPPENWKSRFEAMVSECGLEASMESAFDRVRKYCVQKGIATLPA
jgi:predicted nucleotidyltransferase component of viral defense system